MRQTSILLLTLLSTILWSCNKDKRDFPKVEKLTEFKQTDFLLTLENEFTKDKNLIYCSTFLYAWGEVKDIIKTPLQIDDSLHDLYLITNSNSHLNTLKTGEYSSTGEIDEQLINVKAEFKKSLPFETKLKGYDNELTFDKEKVASFGTIGYNEEASEVIQILYYKDDKNFIIKLLPKDKEHEIILYLTDTNFKSMADIVSDIRLKSNKGQEEKKQTKSGWKYFISDSDEVLIPKIQFNIETNYSELEGNKFHSNHLDYQIEKAEQQTAFILDEMGAEIESESEVAVVALDSVAVEEEKPKPKKMRVDKPFFIMLKRVDHKNPYFGLWTTNTELMLKQ